MSKEIKNRKSVRDDLNNYCYCAKKDDFIEITEWSNEEGWDIQISDKRSFSLTHGELDAINFLIGYLEYVR